MEQLCVLSDPLELAVTQMSWTTSCENCGAVSDFFKDPAGFFVCLECGKQQQAYREEYRDEFDVLFEITGQHTGNITDVRNLSRRQNYVDTLTQNTDEIHLNEDKDQDYNVDVENCDLELEWNKKPPSEADFLRAIQSILMYCTRHFVECLGFPNTLNHMCREIWFFVLKLFVETDYPAQTFFCDLKSRRHKIGIRRTYKPEMTSLDPITILEDEGIPLSIRLTAQQLGANHLYYVKSIAPFYNCSGTRRRGPEPELVKIQSDNLVCEPSRSQDVTEHTGLLLEFSNIQHSEAAHDIQTSVCGSPEQKQKFGILKKKRKTSYLVNKFSALRPKRTVRERQREACLLSGVSPPQSNNALPATRTSVPRYRIPKYMRATPNDKFSKYPSDEQEPTPLGFPESVVGLMTRERGLSLGSKYDPYAHSHVHSRHSHKSTKVSILPNLRWQIDIIYEHDFFVALLDNRRKLSLTEPIFLPLSLQRTSFSNQSKPNLSEPPLQPQQLESSSQWTLFQPIEQYNDEQLRVWIDCCLNENIPTTFIRQVIRQDPLVQYALQEWQNRGLMVSSLMQKTTVNSSCDTVSSPVSLTSTAAHEKFFRHKTLRHELSVTAMIERILRYWMKLTYSLSESSFNTNDMAYQLNELSRIVDLHQICRPQFLPTGTNESSECLVPQNVEKTNDQQKKMDFQWSTGVLLRSYAETIDNLGENSADPRTGYEEPASNPFEPNRDCAAIIPLKRLDPFYHQDDWSSCTVKTQMERLVEWRRILTHCYSTFKSQRDPSKSFTIFDSLAALPPVSMNNNRVLHNDEIIQLLKEAYLASHNLPQLRFLPVFQYILRTSCSWYTHFLRSLAIRELYTLAAPAPLLKARLYNEANLSLDPPKIDHVLIVTLFWIALLNLRYAIVAVDVCRWVETGVLPLNVALSSIPSWLIEASGVCDKYSKFSSLPSLIRQDMIFRDRSILQLSQWIRPSDLERTLLNLKAHGLRLEPFPSLALLPRLLHHCNLPSYLQPLALSLLDMIQNPLTEYQDGYSTISQQKNVVADAIYGYLGPFPSLQTIAASVLIVCRLLWSIFVYQPLGPPGTPHPSKSHTLLKYSPTSTRFLKCDTRESQFPILYFELAMGLWVATVHVEGDVLQRKFSIANMGFISAGLQALKWIQNTSTTDYETLSNQFTEKNRFCSATYQEKWKESSPAALSELHFLFAELCIRGPKQLTLKLKNTKQVPSNPHHQHLSSHDILEWLPTNQQLVHMLIHHSKKPGWLASSQSWMFLNDAWHTATGAEQHIMLSQLAHWIYRPTLHKGKWKDVVLSLTNDFVEQRSLWMYPETIRTDCEHFINEEFTRNEEEEFLANDPSNVHQILTTNANSPDSLDSETAVDVNSIDHLVLMLYRIYFLEILNTFQEPPMPTRCIHPVDVIFKSPVNDSPLDEIRFPVPYALLLRRIASFIGVNHLVVHAATTKIEYWLFVAEVPERFKRSPQS